MQHLQNAVVGRAKEAIEGYGYSGELYVEALEKLESRFGKSRIVVKAHLNRLRKWVKLSDDRLHEVRRFSDVISTAVKTFKRLGYTNELHTANNLNMWIEVQAEVHDDFGIWTSKPPIAPPEHKLKHHRGASAVYSAVTAPSGNSSRFKQSGQFTSPPCVMGDGKCHKLHSCPKFKDLSVVDRLAKVREHGLCFRCFGRHWANKCRCPKQCGVNGCTRLHNELLHRTSEEHKSLSIPSPVEPPIQPSQPEPLVEGSHVMQATSNKSRVLLQVVPVTLYGPCDQLNAHALLDPGSTCSLIRGDVADQLNLDGPTASLDLFGIQVTSHLKTKRVSFNVGPVNETSTHYLVENALVAQKLNVPPASVNIANVRSQAEVKVILGSDITEIVIPREVREGPRGSPFGIKTKLGWTVTGTLPRYSRDSESVCFIHVASPEEKLNELLKSWWKTESFGCKYDSDERRSKEDEMILESLEKTTCKVDERCQSLSRKTLHLLEKRLESDPELRAKYRQTIDDDLQKGYIKKLSEQELSESTPRVWYLPHHPVLNPHKPGKVRRVSDAAAKYQGTSLNNQLSSGPDLLNSLIGILMRFRQELIAMSADIEAMFNQVAVPEEDQSVLRFVWRRTPEDKVDVYQYLRHIFGGFRLTKWISNDKNLLTAIPAELRALSVRSIGEEGTLPTERALGVIWDVQRDAFLFKIKPKELADTRRKVISLTVSVFDPIGFLAPFIVRAKIFLQSLWKLRQGWDEKIPEETQQEWSVWQKELQSLAEFSVPRFYRLVMLSPTSIQLHLFGDASETAFCAVAYSRFEYPGGERQCTFVAKKTRVAPVKPLSIPRLELQAAVLSVRLALACMIQKEHDYEVSSTYYWCDSSAVIGQIRGESKRHPAFTANRLSEILDTSEPQQWRHCPGKLNPADDGSRGLKADSITPNCRWLNGPSFLLLLEYQWPEDVLKSMFAPDVTCEVPEVPGETFMSAVDGWKLNPQFIDLSRYSSFVKVCPITAYVKRFIEICRTRKEKMEMKIGPLEVQEMKNARLMWIKSAQEEVFSADICNLSGGKPVGMESRLRTLTPFLDESDILRVGGRIDRAAVCYDVKHPIIIPQDHQLCRLVIMDCHKRLNHEGTEHIRNELRLLYWIPHSRSTVRKVLNNCSLCKKRRIKLQPPLMASLPKDRLQVAAPFSKIGVDYFGPIMVKYSRKQEKRYGCLFTCSVTRAVHIEVARSLETDSFINSQKQFIARRGPPSDIYSDNGTNFVGANRELKRSLEEWNQSQISDYLSQKDIHWHFNPPATPHSGGIWERLVQSCKKALEVVLHGQVVTDEVLETAFAETEALVNSRPLTEVSSDSGFEAITPNHLLSSPADPVLPCGVFSDKETSSKKRWRQVQVMVDQVWRRWLKEYLPTPTERKRWNLPSYNLGVGDFVLVVDEKTQKGDWPLARVTKIFPGKDDTIRVCEVKTKYGLYKKPVANLGMVMFEEFRHLLVLYYDANLISDEEFLVF
ncbi:uncharacterized protein LOC111343295 [Stylophora pistillata]|uniref:uncharacterized protein LOC111343295 n=1 Tax=Stylophora pistillata TaxID=50429 RepID=UPI000C054099|nr:uncharacterized protein LOC111343295 [Stylophora pistillata]